MALDYLLWLKKEKRYEMGDQNPLLTTLIGLSENVFDGDSAYSLLANLSNLRDEDWETIPAGGERSIADILEHVGWAKWMYQDHAFGSGTIRKEQPFLPRTHPRAELLDWLKEGQRCWIAALRALPTDEELERARPVAWGGTLLTKDIIRILIAHDVYHSGEINHIRALLQANDHW